MIIPNGCAAPPSAATPAAETDLGAARSWHDRALAAALPTGDSPVIAEVLTGLADMALRPKTRDGPPRCPARLRECVASAIVLTVTACG
jgi:hypothetical protein